MKEIKDIVLEYVIQQFGDDEDIEYNTLLISGGLVDSFSLVAISVFIENKFDIKIPDIETIPDNFDSVNKIVKLINKHIKK